MIVAHLSEARYFLNVGFDENKKGTKSFCVCFSLAGSNSP